MRHRSAGVLVRAGFGLLSGLVGIGFFVVGCGPEQQSPCGPGDARELALDLWFEPLSLEPGDFDGDGAIDLLVAGASDNVVAGAIFRGHGDGSFDPPIDAHLVGCSAYPVVGRISDDERDDVVIAGCPSTMTILVGQPDATLAPWAPSPASESGLLRSSAIADFDGDGDGDLLTLRGTVLPAPPLPEIDVMLGAGGGGVSIVETTSLVDSGSTGFDPTHLATGDFDGDALLDVALTERDGDVVRFLGTASATFTSPLELGSAVPPWSTRVRDLDDDGLDDIVVSSDTGSALQVHLSTATGFTDLPVLELSGFAPYDTALGDLDGDDVPDVAIVDDEQSSLRWMPGDGAGGWSEARALPLPSGATRVHAVDLDGDDHDDLIAATFAAGSITLLLGGE